MIAIQIVDENGQNAQVAVHQRLSNILKKVQQSGKLISDGLLWTVRNHFQTIYPDSNHYSPDKVTQADFHNGETPSGAIEIDVPGVTRAYHDMLIKPRFRKYLAIPIHRQSYGKSPKDFGNLIFIQKKNGNKLLAEKTAGGLVFLYALKNQVFQKQDRRLMPSDETLADNIFSRIKAYLSMTK